MRETKPEFTFSFVKSSWFGTFNSGYKTDLRVTDFCFSIYKLYYPRHTYPWAAHHPLDDQ